jgi:hypothetical protein
VRNAVPASGFIRTNSQQNNRHRRTPRTAIALGRNNPRTLRRTNGQRINDVSLPCLRALGLHLVLHRRLAAASRRRLQRKFKPVLPAVTCPIRSQH